MSSRLPSFLSVSHVSVVFALLIVASTPRSARAQALEGSSAVTVRHTLTAELGAVMQARWLPFTRDGSAHAGATGRGWSTSGRVHSNVPVIAVADLDGATRLTGWWLRDATGRLVPWDGRETAVSATIGPGEADVEVQLVGPASSAELLPPVRLRVVAAPRR